MIIDFHTHVFPDKIANATVAALAKSTNIPAYSDGTLDSLLLSLEEAGVDVAVNLPVLTRPTQFDSVLNFASVLNEKSYTGSRIISFAGAHPDMENPEEKLALVKERGFLGIKIHPDYQATFFDDEKYLRILRVAKELDLITLTHAGVDGAYPGEPVKCTPERVLRALDKIGGYDKLVLAHYGANFLFDEVLRSLAGLPIYFDTAYMLHNIDTELFLKILDRHGSERVLFATDSPWRNIKEEVEMIKRYHLDPVAENNIFSQNAKKLLKIR